MTDESCFENLNKAGKFFMDCFNGAGLKYLL